MSRADLSYAYAQARLQSRFGERPHSSDWQHLEATRDVGAVLQVVRAGRLARWTARITSRPGVHELERRLREEWMRAVDEVASWQPEQWREGTHWMRWYSAWLSARLSLSASRCTVGLSPTIRLFIHGSLKSADRHHI